MTIAETTSQTRNSYTGNGIATVYNFTFIVLEESNQVLNRDYTIEVTLSENNIDTIQQEGVDYTVQLGENGLGTVTFTTAPTATQTITFLSSIPRTQSTDYINIGTDKFPADSHEGTVDKLTLISREQDEAVNRAILLPESSNLTGVNMPVSVANANKAIVVNGAGDDLIAKNLADVGIAPVTDYAKTLLDDNNASEARTTLSIDRRVTVDNANYTILATDKVVAQIGTMSTARTFSLPAASTVEAGAEIIVIDESGSVDSTNKITVQRNGTDTIEGATSIEILQAYGILKLICNGDNSWKIANRLIATQAEVDAWTNKLKLITPETLANRNIPMFRSYINSAQTIATSTVTKVQFDTESFDTNSWYDNTTNYRFTPLKAGKYLVVSRLIFNNNNLSSRDIYINKNGFSVAQQGIYNPSGYLLTNTVSTIIEMNGSTDYLEVYAAQNTGGNADTFTGLSTTEFSAIYIGI